MAAPLNNNNNEKKIPNGSWFGSLLTPNEWRLFKQTTQDESKQIVPPDPGPPIQKSNPELKYSEKSFKEGSMEDKSQQNTNLKAQWQNSKNNQDFILKN